MTLTKTISLITTCCSLMAAQLIQAAPLRIDLNFTLDMEEMLPPEPSVDYIGLKDTVWTLTYIVEDPVYVPKTDQWASQLSALVSSSITLTISGASNPDLNGTFDIVFNSSPNGLIVPRYSSNGAYGVWGLNEAGVLGSFTFSSLNLEASGLLINSTSPSQVPPLGSEATTADFDGLIITGGQVVVSNGIYASSYAMKNGTIHATELIPEPSVYAVALSALSLLVVAFRRHRK